MGSRKDIIKRSLGITDYPWSSDDELEAATLAVEETSLRRPPAEPRTSASDAPGYIGPPPPISQHHQQQQLRQMNQQQSQHQNQHQQEALSQRRQDRDLFWSIINSPYRVSNQRSNEVSSTPRISQILARDASRRNPRLVGDVQRIMDFNRLTRNLGALRHRSYLTGVIPVTRVNPGVIVPSEANSSIIINRHGSSSLRGRLPPAPYTYPPAPVTYPPAQITPPPAPVTSSPSRNGHVSPPEPAANAVARELLRAARASRNVAAQPARAPSLVHSEDEMNNNPAPPTVHPEGQRLLTLDEANEESGASMEAVEGSSANVPLEDDIAVSSIALDNNDVPTQILSAEEEEVRADTSAPAAASDVHFTAELRRTATGDTKATTSGASGDANHEQSKHTSKKKSRDANESLEPGTVKEFNQSLLRLLECPVCLEWMEPPMSQCRRGHLVCGRCRARLSSCPVCRTTFSSVRNRAMEGVSELLRYPCRHGCGREVRLRRRAPHEASCAARNYHCPAPLCADVMPMPRDALGQHFQSLHLTEMKIGRRHKFSMKVNSEQHENWLILTMEEYFHLKIDVDIHTWGVVVYVSYIGPKCDAKNYTYEVTIDGQHNQRKLAYSRTTHSDLENCTLNVSRQDCFHLTLDQALNFIRFKNRHCEADKYLDFNLEITKVERSAVPPEESDS